MEQICENSLDEHAGLLSDHRHYLGRRLIAGASYGYLEILLCNILCYILEALGSRKRLLYKRLCKYGPT